MLFGEAKRAVKCVVDADCIPLACIHLSSHTIFVFVQEDDYFS